MQTLSSQDTTTTTGAKAYQAKEAPCGVRSVPAMRVSPNGAFIPTPSRHFTFGMFLCMLANCQPGWEQTHLALRWDLDHALTVEDLDAIYTYSYTLPHNARDLEGMRIRVLVAQKQRKGFYRMHGRRRARGGK